MFAKLMLAVPASLVLLVLTVVSALADGVWD